MKRPFRLLLGGLLAVSLLAQAPPTSDALDGKIVEQITVQGLHKVKESNVLSQMMSQVGKQKAERVSSRKEDRPDVEVGRKVGHVPALSQVGRERSKTSERSYDPSRREGSRPNKADGHIFCEGP